MFKVIGTNTAENYVSKDERWDWLLSTLFLDDVFVHEVLLLMDKSSTTKCPTMGVRVDEARIKLEVNPKFVDSLNDAQVRYVLKHECLHVVLHHCTTRLPEDPKERDLWNRAADLAVNSLIPLNTACEIPTAINPETGKKEPNALLPSKYGFPEKLSMEQYVLLLREQDRKDQEEGKKKKQYQYGGGMGQAGTGDSDGPDGDQQGGGSPQNMDSHEGWGDSEIADEQIRQKVEQMANSSTSWGNMSEDVKQLILAAQTSQIAWHRILREYFGHLISTKAVHTFKRPNRRFGYPFSGTKRGYMDKKLVAIDTSGSVPDRALSQFLTECNKLAERTPVDVCLFDADITQMPKPFTRRHAKYEFNGRGGTCFQAVCDLASERKYQSLIILTDGYASPVDKPQGVRDVIWVITPDGQFPVNWGTQIKMKEEIL